MDLSREFRLLRRVTFFHQLKKVTKKSRHYAGRPVKSTGFPLRYSWYHAVKKLAENAQTVFTESPRHQLYLSGLANVREIQKQATKSKKTESKASRIKRSIF